MQSLFAQYRPNTWEGLIGHKQMKVAVARMRSMGSLGGRSFFITGKSGVGKTTAAYLIAGDICDTDNFVELDATDITPAKLDELERGLRYKCIGEKTGRAVLINEVHGLRTDTIKKLLVVLERIPNHVVWIFTCTEKGANKLFQDDDAHPLVSRCIEFRLQPATKSFAARAQEIAEAEDLGGALSCEYEDLVERCQCNLRKVLCEIEAGCMIREEIHS